LSAARREATANAAETEALGAQLAAELQPGDVVLVGGELGSGKTTLIRGACRALGVSEPIVSPTFTIGRRYEGRGARVSHLDLFRLEDLGAEEPGMLDDYLTSDAISFVEWPGVAAGHLDRDGVRVAWQVELRHAGGDRREVLIAPGAIRATRQ
jgi:tRNA threonylcarbamoyladenosine biosynthesis protein TsaE